MAQLIVALDCEAEKAKELVKTLLKKVKLFKVGPILFVKEGPKIIDWITSQGGLVFLDLKLHDIPNTVRNTIKVLKEFSLYSLSIHISGGTNMLKVAVEEAEDKIRLWGVTILTSIDKFEYSKISFRYSLEKQILHFSKIAKEVGLDGVIISPRDLCYVRAFVKDINFITPSIRLNEVKDNDDQKRYMTPKEAVNLGSHYIVVGRPIIESEDPLKVVDRIYEEMERE